MGEWVSEEGRASRSAHPLEGGPANAADRRLGPLAGGRNWLGPGRENLNLLSHNRKVLFANLTYMATLDRWRRLPRRLKRLVHLRAAMRVIRRQLLSMPRGEDAMETCKGKNALVTGASRGIGRAIAKRLAAEGANVVLSASRPGRHGDLQGTLEEATEELEGAGGRAAAAVADLLDEQARSDLVARAEACFGPLDILVNNAAMGAWAMPSQSTLQDRRKMLEVNLHAPVDLAQQVLPGMRSRGCGWVLNIGSASDRQPPVPYRDSPEAAHVITAYGATKAALDRYMQGLAHEVAGDGVFVNVLAPVSIVLTQEAARFVGHIAKNNPDMTEPIEVMVEAAVELCTERHVGQVLLSRELLHRVARPVRSLDGLKVIGDALLAADLEAVVL
jgi:NAD(P)-dependent dehydrogenase (short-subunit alcohol dehydrogenase family)